MTQLPPTLSHELADYDTWGPADTMTSADLRSDGCDHVLTSGDREGEVCGRELPCRFHS